MVALYMYSNDHVLCFFLITLYIYSANSVIFIPVSLSIYSADPQGLREGDETDAEHRGPRCLGKSRGGPLYRKKKGLASDFGII